MCALVCVCVCVCECEQKGGRERITIKKIFNSSNLFMFFFYFLLPVCIFDITFKNFYIPLFLLFLFFSHFSCFLFLFSFFSRLFYFCVCFSSPGSSAPEKFKFKKMKSIIIMAVYFVYNMAVNVHE